MSTPTASAPTKVMENRARRSAERQGWRLSRSRTRDPRALAYGRYWLTPIPGMRKGAKREFENFEAVERFLLGDD